MGEHIGFIGLGRMGARMCVRLLDAGHTLTVYDVNEAAAAALVARGANKSSSPAGVADAAAIVLASLPSAALLLLDPTLLAPEAMPAAVGWATLAGAVLMLAADRLAMTIRRVEHMRVADALTFGFCQLFAALPGVRPEASIASTRIRNASSLAARLGAKPPSSPTVVCMPRFCSTPFSAW